MTKQMKNCIDVKNSSVLTTPNGATSVPAGKPADITVSITGVSNRIVHAYRKAFYEFLIEETRGYIFTELRLTKKIEAARLLFPEDKQKVRGLNVTIK